MFEESCKKLMHEHFRSQGLRKTSLINVNWISMNPRYIVVYTVTTPKSCRFTAVVEWTEGRAIVGEHHNCSGNFMNLPSRAHCAKGLKTRPCAQAPRKIINCLSKVLLYILNVCFLGRFDKVTVTGRFAPPIPAETRSK